MMKDAFLRKRRQLESFTRARGRLRAKPSPRREDLRHVTCKECGERVILAELRQEQYICRHCQALLPMPAAAWLELLLDAESFRERDKRAHLPNPLAFPGYEEKLTRERERTGQSDAILTGSGRIAGIEVAIGVMDNRFMMGSMGTVVGERLTRLIEWATKRKRPLILVATSGGARMQEGVFSLMQMAKTAQALNRFHEAGLFYLVIYTHPVTGGVLASFASLADVILAEPNALIGFAGPRVISETLGETLPEGFQRAPYTLEHGLIDQVVDRWDLRREVAFYLDLHKEAPHESL